MSTLLRPRLGGLDPVALARAEAALAGLSSQFETWLGDETTKLKAAYADLQSSGIDGAAGERFHRHAHDLKGLGGTYGYPLVTRLAASLCKLTETPQARVRAPLPLIAGHVEAIATAVRRKMKTDEDSYGSALAETLETAVAALR